MDIVVNFFKNVIYAILGLVMMAVIGYLLIISLYFGLLWFFNSDMMTTYIANNSGTFSMIVLGIFGFIILIVIGAIFG